MVERKALTTERRGPTVEKASLTKEMMSNVQLLSRTMTRMK